MIDKEILDRFYIENLEENIIGRLAEIKKIDLQEATRLYFNSEICRQIEAKKFGIENLDYKILADAVN